MAYNDPGEPFFPSNGTEGMRFEENNCNQCYKRSRCSIMMGALTGLRKPRQWIYDGSGKPVCTSIKTERPKRMNVKAENPSQGVML